MSINGASRLLSALAVLSFGRRAADIPAVRGHDGHHVAGGPTISHGVELHLHFVAGLQRGFSPASAAHFPDARHFETIGGLRAVRRGDHDKEPTMRITPF